MSGFQTHVNAQPAPGVAGDFASTNPRASVPPAVAGAWKVAAGQAVKAGNFAWGNSATGLVYSSLAAAGSDPVLGFVGRTANEPSVLITDFLGESSMTLNAGLPVTLFSSGDYWAQLPGANAGDIIYADATNGAPTLDDNSGANPDTGFKASSAAAVNAVTNATPGVTFAANTGVMTVAGANASGSIVAGQRVTGGTLPANVFVTAQLTGTAGQAGTYQTTYVNRAAIAAAFQATLIQGGLAKISRS